MVCAVHKKMFTTFYHYVFFDCTVQYDTLSVLPSAYSIYYTLFNTPNINSILYQPPFYHVDHIITLFHATGLFGTTCVDLQ